MILSQDGLVVTVIDKRYALHTWTLADLCAPLSETPDLTDRKMKERMALKLDYVK